MEFSSIGVWDVRVVIIHDPAALWKPSILMI
jgi:hypothetical protein